MKIAISGKGGVGKTSIMALLAQQLKESGKEVLVIDADPSPHMAQTLGVGGVDKVKPIAEMTDLLIERSGKTPGSPFYQINPMVDDLLDRFMVEHDNIRLMVLGAVQTAEGGCACPENNVLRRMLTKLLLSPSQVVLLDMEAGVEHLGRGTIAGVDHLLIVVNPTQSSIRTASKVHKLAVYAGIPRISFVGNLVRDQEDVDFLRERLDSPPIASLPDSNAIRKAERNGVPVTTALSEVATEIGQLADVLMGEKS